MGILKRRRRGIRTLPSRPARAQSRSAGGHPTVVLAGGRGGGGAGILCLLPGQACRVLEGPSRLGGLPPSLHTHGPPVPETRAEPQGASLPRAKGCALLDRAGSYRRVAGHRGHRRSAPSRATSCEGPLGVRSAEERCPYRPRVSMSRLACRPAHPPILVRHPASGIEGSRRRMLTGYYSPFCPQ